MSTIALPARHTFTIWEGTTWRQTITVLSAGAGSPPRDLTGYNSTFTIYPAPDQTPLLVLSSLTGGITLGGINGAIDLYISNTVTSTFDSWPSEAAIYELTLTNTGGNGDVEPILFGAVRVLGYS